MRIINQKGLGGGLNCVITAVVQPRTNSAAKMLPRGTTVLSGNLKPILTHQPVPSFIDSVPVAQIP